MIFSIKPFFYRTVIDPLLSGLHRSILVHVDQSQRVLDVACGVGTLALMMARKAGHVTGIDISEEVISAARHAAERSKADHITFEVRDASELSLYPDNEFDVAVASMAVHQFDADLAVKILAGMKRISSSVLIADYNYAMGRGWKQSLAWFIERMAQSDHYRNFRTYMKLGGLRYFASQAGLTVIAEEIKGGGVFVVMLARRISE